MSPHAANSLVADLVEMAQAVEELPKVKEELELEKANNTDLQVELASKDAETLDLKAQIESLQASLKLAEANRDDAEYRFLEAEERVNRFRDLAKGAGDVLGLVITEPVKPEPVVEPAPETANIEPVPYTPALAPEPANTSVQGSVSFATSEPEVSLAIPTVEASPSTVSSYGAVETVAAQSSEPSVTSRPQPYAGKRYLDIPNYVDLNDWIAGGGLERDYWQR